MRVLLGRRVGPFGLLLAIEIVHFADLVYLAFLMYLMDLVNLALFMNLTDHYREFFAYVGAMLEAST